MLLDGLDYYPKAGCAWPEAVRANVSRKRNLPKLYGCNTKLITPGKFAVLLSNSDLKYLDL